MRSNQPPGGRPQFTDPPRPVHADTGSNGRRRDGMPGPGGPGPAGESAAVPGGRLRRAAALLLLAGALALLLFGDGVVVQAQTPPPLVSNIGQDLDFYGTWEALPTERRDSQPAPTRAATP